MNILETKLFKYSLDLKQGLSLKGRELRKREGLILQMTNDDGVVGFGEIAPLPGFSKEDLAQARHQAVEIARAFVKQEVPEDLERLNGGFNEWVKSWTLLPSVRFGLETAVLTLKARAAGISLARLLHNEYDSQLGVNALIPATQKDDADATARRAEDLVGRGYTSIKLKVGTEDTQDEVRRIRAVQTAVGEKALLRLDANQGWSFEQALQIAETIGPAAAEYIEEPFDDPFRIPAFYEKAMIPVALDESLSKLPVGEIKAITGVEVLILKPTLIGGIQAAMDFAREAQGQGIRAVVSSSFESGWGLRVLAHLASGFSQHVAVGLDTGQWFTEDLVERDWAVDHGRLAVEEDFPTRVLINPKFLQEVGI